MEKATDFRISDFYQLVADNREVRVQEHRVVIVGIDGLSREEIADVIEQVNYCAPKVIGLDLFFGYPQSAVDSLLVEVIRDCPNIVLPTLLRKVDEGYFVREATAPHSLYDRITTAKRGVVNLEANSNLDVVRSYRPFFLLQEGGALPSFAAELLRLYAPDEYNVLCERQRELETIYYPSYEYEIISPTEVLEQMDEIQDKIVLIGTVDDPLDMHTTTISKATPGVLIHACALSTLLDANYLYTVPEWLNWVVAILLCTLFVSIGLWLCGKEIGGLMMRIFQMALLYFVVWIGCRMFLTYRLDIDFTRPLLMVSLGLVALDIWMGGKELKEFFVKYYLRVRSGILTSWNKISKKWKL